MSFRTTHTIQDLNGNDVFRDEQGTMWVRQSELVEAVKLATKVATKRALEQAAEVVSELQSEVGGHTSTYSVRRWLRARANNNPEET